MQWCETVTIKKKKKCKISIGKPVERQAAFHRSNMPLTKTFLKLLICGYFCSEIYKSKK